ncbi:uncharacterized protein LOC143917757 [Arctopsyche grandis]|uniref:uncharacterized protein LOC143917757 n=1 Tax=Arctopsyche grandis TaxID=121162 RepID=UPI00406D62EB
MIQWQQRWESATGGRWTQKLVGDLKQWCGRTHGDLSYHLTQLLAGHGCFGTYLHKIGKEATPICHQCEAADDDAEHTLLHCPAWDAPRQALKAAIGEETLWTGMVMGSMLHDRGSWSAWEAFAASVIGEKLQSERERRRQEPASELEDSTRAPRSEVGLCCLLCERITQGQLLPSNA